MTAAMWTPAAWGCRKIVPLIRDYSGSEAVFEASDDFLRTTLPAKLTEQATR